MKPSPYAFGLADGRAGLGAEDNPYEKDTKEYRDWMVGWAEAQMEERR